MVCASDNQRMNPQRTLAGLRAVAVHGAGGGGWEWLVWQRLWQALGAHVEMPDLQPARAGLAATGLADYCAQIEWHARQGPRPVLLGASLGGLIALEVAGRVAAPALVLVNPLPPAGVQPRPRPREYHGAIVPWGRRASLDGTRRALPDADDAAAIYALRRWRDESVRVLVDAERHVCAAPACPVLVIAGAEDGDIAPAASQALAGRLQAEFMRIEGCSHVGPLLGRRAAAIAAAAARWLAQQSLQS